MTRRQIPQVPSPNQPRRAFDVALKENLEVISGVRGATIELLDDSASTQEIIDKINAIINKLQT